VVSTSAFDADAAWRVSPQVAIRPESFGALAYHFGTRRLSFLKSRLLLRVVESLGEHPSARAACVAAGISADDADRYADALAVLASTDMIERVPA
jgi:mycofactocin biosynthesis protein MftB